MEMVKDTAFYDAQSAQYSDSRYPRIVQTYTQAFFKRRLALTMTLVRAAIGAQKGAAILEIGCADGIVVRSLNASFPDTFSSMIGIDVSEKMIDAARMRTHLPNATFVLRKQFKSSGPFDLILEIGVVGFAGVQNELPYVRSILTKDGSYILSVAGTNSLAYRLGRAKGFGELHTYREYEALIREHFTIQKSIGYGLFVPYLWRIPSLARVLQPFFDSLANIVLPSLCHEKLYLLTKRI